MNISEEILQQIIGCERHGHSASGVELPQHVYRDLVSETLPAPHCFKLDCDHDECKRYRTALSVKPGDDAGSIWGIEMHVIADQPKFTMLHEKVPT